MDDETTIHRSEYSEQRKVYYHAKSPTNYAFKVQIACDFHLRIVHVPRESGLLEHTQEDVQSITDKEYISEQYIYYFEKKPCGGHLTAKDKDFNRSICSTRAAIENINQRLKNYAILGHVYKEPYYDIDKITTITHVVSALCNLQLSTHLIQNVVSSLRCKTASPSNCHHNLTCTYGIKECHSPEFSSNSRGGMYCTTILDTNNNNEIIVGKMDCMYDQETGKICKNQTQCIMTYTNKDKLFLHCCCNKDNCNYNFIISNLSEGNSSTISSTTERPIYKPFLRKPIHIILLCLIIGFLIILIIIFIICRKKFPRSGEKLIRLFDKSSKMDENLYPFIEKSKEINIKELTIENLIKKGRFSLIYQGKLNNEQVAIKSISNKNDLIHSNKLFENEKDIYSLPNMDHENIVKYYGYSITNDNNYIILELSKYGSLRDVLRKRLLKDEYELILISKQISNGLEYLHNDFRRNNSKENSRPPIAHRDFKSDNILYLNDHRLVIADFAMANQLTQNQIYPYEQQQIGTARYMSPEILAGTIGCETNALLKCDVYALGIVFWEILSRYPYEEETNIEYEMAYEKQLIQHGLDNINPQVNDILQIINLEKPNNRPLIKSLWRKSNKKSINEILLTMEQCWDQNPEGRISAALVALRMRQLS
ncbi:unnamed protein product [Rotaria sordida]|uniref:receptor protein serine/threonine kinase n=1 Tax=Rotaria sordida TaxID=392033 RepID=A0A819Q832_9BILA|nr:unnamed protein product [Rotaria sordida]CAF4027339.1 unnamed protein product [Rotaria sordida]